VNILNFTESGIVEAEGSTDSLSGYRKLNTDEINE